MVTYRIYGKHGSQRRFCAMNINQGYQVHNLVYATILTEEEKNKFMKEEAPRNAPEWTFEARPIE